MNIVRIDLPSAALIETRAFVDDRGAFRRLHCQKEFEAAGLPAEFVQSNLSLTRRRGSIRGMHFQKPPSKEGKLVRCVRGAIHDVIIDLRRESKTYLKHHAVTLKAGAELSLFVPSGFAHGFQTLTDDSEVLYLMSDFFAPALSDGVRWDDPAFGIDWPLPLSEISERDANYPDFNSETDYGFPIT